MVKSKDRCIIAHIRRIRCEKKKECIEAMCAHKKTCSIVYGLEVFSYNVSTKSSFLKGALGGGGFFERLRLAHCRVRWAPWYISFSYPSCIHILHHPMTTVICGDTVKVAYSHVYIQCGI